MSEGKFDPHRRLCPDGTCIGVIGDDGKCRVCGRVGGGGGAALAAAAAGGAAAASPVGDEDRYEDEDDDDEDGDAEPKEAGGVGFDSGRKLCPDDNCIGVIGAEGVCSVCGTKAD